MTTLELQNIAQDKIEKAIRESEKARTLRELKVQEFIAGLQSLAQRESVLQPTESIHNSVTGNFSRLRNFLRRRLNP